MTHAHIGHDSGRTWEQKKTGEGQHIQKFKASKQ